MKIATLEKRIDGMRGDAALYRLSEPMKTWSDTTTDHVVVSAVRVLGVPETYIFAADASGEVTGWGELEGSFRGGLDHAEALRGAGYELGTATPSGEESK